MFHKIKSVAPVADFRLSVGSIYIMDFPDNVQSAPSPTDRSSNWVKVKTN